MFEDKLFSSKEHRRPKEEFLGRANFINYNIIIKEKCYF